MPLIQWPFEDLAIANANAAKEPGVELQVIGAGLPRTGTASMQAALTILGFGPCHHAATLFRNPNRTAMYLEAINAKNPDWRKVMAGFRATVDMPGCALVPELHAAFPKAKVVLTIRDSPEVWGKSMRDTIKRMATPLYVISILPIRYLRLQMLCGSALAETRWKPQYGQNLENIGWYDKHTEWVRSIVPKDQLLEFNVKEGWAPLCKFLDVPVPDMPFPRTNESSMLNRNITNSIRLGLAAWAGYAGMLGALLYLFVFSDVGKRSLSRVATMAMAVGHDSL